MEKRRNKILLFTVAERCSQAKVSCFSCVLRYEPVFASLLFSLLCAWHLVPSIESSILTKCTMCWLILFNSIHHSLCHFHPHTNTNTHTHPHTYTYICSLHFLSIFLPFYLCVPFILFHFHCFVAINFYYLKLCSALTITLLIFCTVLLKMRGKWDTEKGGR